MSTVTDEGAEIKRNTKMPKKTPIFFSGLQRFEKYTILSTSDTLSCFQFMITYFSPIQRHFRCMFGEIWTWSHPSRPSAEFKILARRSQVTAPARLNELVQYLHLQVASMPICQPDNFKSVFGSKLDLTTTISTFEEF